MLYSDCMHGHAVNAYMRFIVIKIKLKTGLYVSKKSIHV